MQQIRLQIRFLYLGSGLVFLHLHKAEYKVADGFKVALIRKCFPLNIIKQEK